jgi:hypothetical protein
LWLSNKIIEFVVATDGILFIHRHVIQPSSPGISNPRLYSENPLLRVFNLSRRIHSAAQGDVSNPLAVRI